jgi:small-conductance mechanosensitive channel
MFDWCIMRFDAKNVCRVLFLVLIVSVLVFSDGQLAAQEPKVSQPAVAEKEKPPALPGLADLIPLATELSGRLAVLENKIAAGLNVSELEKRFFKITENLEDYSAQLEKLKASGDYRYSQLVQLKTAVEGEAASLGKVSKGLTEEIRRLGDAREQWLTKQKQWQEWQSALLKDEPLTEVKSTFVQAQATIDKALNLILQKLKPMLAVQKKVGNIQAKIETVSADTDGLISALRGGVLIDSSPPMFSSKYFSQFSSELGHRTQKGLDQASWSPTPFLALNGWVVLLQFLLSIFLIITIFRNRHKLQDSERWRFVARRPFSIGLFVSYVTLTPFYEGSPTTWYFPLVAIIAISFARLIAGLIEVSWKKHFVYGLVIFLLATRVLQLVTLPLPLYRLFIALAALVGLVLCLWWSWVRGRRGDSPFYTWALRLGALFLLVVLTAEIWGKASLAEYLLDCALRTITALISLWLFMQLVHGGLEWTFKKSPLRRVTPLRDNAATITRKLALFIDVIIGALMLSAVLVIWRIDSSTAEAMKAIFSFGFTLGSQRISVGLVVAAGGIIYGAFVISWIIQKLLVDEVLANRQVDLGVRLSIGRLVHYALILIGLLLALVELGFELTKITIILSALGVGIGFGLQGIVNNFVSGLVLLFERPIKVGDYIQLGEQWATIQKIGLRATVVQTWDRSEIVVPNSDLVSNQVTNWTLSDRMSRIIIPVGVEYGSDVPLVKETLEKCAMASSKVLRMPEPQILFLRFGESSLDFELRVWISDIDERIQLTSDLHQEIDRRFREAGIVIAFPQRDLHVRSVEESPGSITKVVEDRRADLVVVPTKEKDEEGEKYQ